MSDLRFRVADDDLPQNAETREAQHELLASFLAAHGDGELPAETGSQIEAHLAGCARCRRELEVHRALRDRLSREPVPAATASLRDRIATGIRLAPAVDLSSAAGSAAAASVGAVEGLSADLATSRSADRGSGLASDRRLRIAFVALLVAALALPVAWVSRDAPARSEPSALTVTSQSIPLFAAVLADYRRVTGADLPGRARDLGAVRAAVPFPVTPLVNPELRLLAAWTTSLAGEPAAVLAYRWNDRVVLQYLVTEGLLFQSPGVRSSLAQQHAVAARDGAQGLLLWAQPESGSVLVGDLQPGELAALHSRDEGR